MKHVTSDPEQQDMLSATNRAQARWRWYDWVAMVFIFFVGSYVGGSLLLAFETWEGYWDAIAFALFFTVVAFLGWFHSRIRGFTSFAKSNRRGVAEEGNSQVRRQWWDYIVYIAIIVYSFVFVELLGIPREAEGGWGVPLIFIILLSLCWIYNRFRGFTSFFKKRKENFKVSDLTDEEQVWRMPRLMNRILRWRFLWLAHLLGKLFMYSIIPGYLALYFLNLLDHGLPVWALILIAISGFGGYVGIYTLVILLFTRKVGDRSNSLVG